MISINEVIETNAMISRMNLDVRTITMGISLLDCVGGTLKETCDNIYNKITTKAKDLVYTGEEISKKYGIPSVFPSHRSHWSVAASARQVMIL